LATTSLEMTMHGQVSRDEEDRLAALSEQPLANDPVVDAADDAIASLFSAPDATRVASHPRMTGTRAGQTLAGSP
jgi:hypothetical protein